MIAPDAWTTPLLTHPWAYPVLEIAHLLGMALVVGNLVLLEWRVWGGGAALPVAALARVTLTLVATGTGLAVASGGLMALSRWDEWLANPAFLAKMGLLAFAAVNAALFHARKSLTKLDAVARLQAAMSLIVWLAVIAAGRWMAYV